MRARSLVWRISIILVWLIGFLHLQAKPPDNLKSQVDPTSLAIDNTTWIDANKILMFVTNHGNIGRDLTNMFGQDAGTFYPYLDTSLIMSGELTTCVVFAAGLWVGGKVNGETRVTIAEYSDEYVPGPMLNGSHLPDQPEFKVYKLYRDSLESSPNDDYVNWPVDQGAPVDSDGKPAMRGDQMLWTVYNDADPAGHTNDAGETEPLGIEIKQTVWATDESGSIEIPVPREMPIIHIGSSSGRVTFEVLDYKLLNGHDYQVTFDGDPNTGSTWNLTDLTTGQLLLVNQPGQDGEGVDVNGMFRVRVYAPVQGVRPGDRYSHPDDPDQWGWDVPNGTRRFTWANADGFRWEGFRGALGWGGPGDTHGFGSNDPVPGTDLPNVLLQLAPIDANGNFDPNHPDVSYAYRYLRAPGPPARPEFGPYIVDPNPPGGSYGFQDFEKSCPLSAWNVSVDPPQRLTIGYLENNVEFGLVDGKYWPPDLWHDEDNISGSGPREWLWIFLDDYSEIVNPNYALNAIEDPMPIMYWATWARRSQDAWVDEDEFLFIPETEQYISSADTFTFIPVAPEMLSSGPEGLTIYIQYELENKGAENITDMYIGLWSDPDLGGAGDDLVGCDPEDNLWYCYNATDSDDQFFNFSPAVGFKLLHGPVVPSPGDTAWFNGVLLPDHKNLQLSAVLRYINGTDPNSFDESYNYMSGRLANGDPYIYNGDTTTFMHAGDPVTGTGDLDFDPADRRMFGSVGPITMAPGDKQMLVFKMSVGQGMNRLASVTNLRDVLNSSTWLGDNVNCCGFYSGGHTGNIDFDSEGKRNLADLVRLIDNVYLSKRPFICGPNSNINGDLDGKVNLADIVRLIDHLYISGRETAACL